MSIVGGWVCLCILVWVLCDVHCMLACMCYLSWICLFIVALWLLLLGEFVLGVGPYLYMEDLLRLDRCRPQEPVRLSPALEDVVTPLKWRECDWCLASHPDQRFREYVVGGIRDGFCVGFDYAGSCSPARGSMVSAKQHAAIVSEGVSQLLTVALKMWIKDGQALKFWGDEFDKEHKVDDMQSDHQGGRCSACSWARAKLLLQSYHAGCWCNLGLLPPNLLLFE